MQNPIRFSGFFFLAAAIAYPFAAPTFAADQTCADPAASPPQSGVCAVTAGDNGRLLRGTVLLEDGVVTNGSVMVDASGTIVCAGCGCQSATGADTATRIDCAQGVISPGLIDAYNHVTFTPGATELSTETIAGAMAKPTWFDQASKSRCDPSGRVLRAVVRTVAP